jgi:hypothetical protein
MSGASSSSSGRRKKREKAIDIVLKHAQQNLPHVVSTSTLGRLAQEQLTKLVKPTQEKMFQNKILYLMCNIHKLTQTVDTEYYIAMKTGDQHLLMIKFHWDVPNNISTQTNLNCSSETFVYPLVIQIQHDMTIINTHRFDRKTEFMKALLVILQLAKMQYDKGYTVIWSRFMNDQSDPQIRSKVAVLLEKIVKEQ